MISLIDTNVLVYRFDPRFPNKQRAARELLREGIENDAIRVPHQAIIEFVHAVTRPIDRSGAMLVSRPQALLEAEAMLAQFVVLYPNEQVVRLAVRGAATYQLSWFDAHIWAYAEHFGLREIVSEDFCDGQVIGAARIRNPFRE